MVTRIGYVVFTTLFLFFVIQVSALVGASIIAGFDAVPVSVNTGNLTILTFPLFILENFFIFISLMSVSSEFLLLGTILIPAFVIGFLWAVIEIIAIAIP